MINVTTVSVGELDTNCFVVTDKVSGRTAVIDPGEYNGSLDEVITQCGCGNIDYILLTHGHFDHVGGVSKIVEKTGGTAKVCIYADEVRLLNNPRSNLSLMFTGVPLSEINVDVELHNGDEIKLGSSTFTVMHTPGHTSGSVCFICGRDIFTGDTLFCRSAGRTDFPTGSSKQLMQSLSKLSALDGDYTVYPGHFGKTTLEEERNENPYLNNYF